MSNQHDSFGRSNRRRFLAGSAAIGSVTLAGCTGLFGGADNEETVDSSVGQIGSGREGRDAPGGTPIAEMPDLEGELTIYSGRGEFLVGELISFFDDTYPDFDPVPRYGSGSDLVTQIETEGEGTPADVFYTVDSGGLGALADAGRTQALSSEITDLVRDEFHTEQWTGISGRARSVPFNTDAYSASEIPSNVMAFPDFEGDMGWAPSYPSCQGFVTAMRQLEGDEATREWLQGIVDSGIESYPDEYAVSQAVADGELDAGFANHYYIQRVLDGSPNAPIETAFTEGDAGSIFDVAGAAVIDQADDPELAQNFIRHLLSAEAQEYFAVETFEYPLISGVDPVGRLPSIDELDVPDLTLSELSDVETTIDMMRDVGIQT
ncbi:iron(III) transport system substrate-binding protein [Halohasta litchfieldiae]|uniref:Iron(III) transport system substrate-binding protein n=1 Tax=Halohasta litchfieldiae TaxID=1073996 RepID=A0A1H6R8V0_9EURY|nr:extracellular solute-binding protein [Halohasta litchfieldiae]ATW88542.1 iron(III) transport system substrate-binding protein [Halohasta litchfieldiae]SEI48937.1 iron(III) transport system substrate-binding protein [Halohasta litchfieldiae]